MLHELSLHLSPLPLGPLEYHPTLPSTTDLAAERLDSGSPDLTLIVADEQTAGRGRRGRRWHTPPGAALAFSLVLRPNPDTPLWAHAPLGALAVHSALTDAYGLPAEIKWPNDVLVGGKKVCGVLAEAHWQGDRLAGVVLGIGVNVAPEAVPPGELPFPAGSVAGALEAAGRSAAVDRWELLAGILSALLEWRAQTGAAAFLSAWEARLAYLGREVVVGELAGGPEARIHAAGVLAGLAPEGALRLQTETGEITIPAGELSLRLKG
ncbi:MAG TPA: biotin--[acetyl-CoA-carboxylase] ligase [Anaerolineales bacterium]|nr:biotin--[acetyl-CoA-carboxylase] ligase [Anaerolineales bacterium]